jgi:glutathione peroxidase
MSIHDIEVKTIDGRAEKLSAYRDRTMLIVNVASQCGFTPQYTGLEALFRKYKDRGLVVLGFPCNQFGHQEPGDDKEIQHFCSLNYNVSFPLFSKIQVNGEDAHPLYQYLKSQSAGSSGPQDIEWNFTKFLLDKDGTLIRRYGPRDTPENIDKDLETLLH